MQCSSNEMEIFEEMIMLMIFFVCFSFFNEIFRDFVKNKLGLEMFPKYAFLLIFLIHIIKRYS